MSGRHDPVVPLRVASTAPTLALLEALQAGSSAAVAELFDRFAPAARGMLLRMLGDSADVDDLVQDTFLTVLRRIDAVREPECLRSFVVGVAAHLARNHLRKRAVRRWVGLSEIPDLPFAGVADAETLQRLRHLYRALDRLERARGVLALARSERLCATASAWTQRPVLAAAAGAGSCVRGVPSAPTAAVSARSQRYPVAASA